ncbi:MAG: hypothetical protein Q4A32_06705 [Lachnospiraceae bacterium]|nr:hypothetical protein [Lachnospiraceae bacterium]
MQSFCPITRHNIWERCTAGEAFSALINYGQLSNPSDSIKQLCNRSNAFRDQIEKYLIEIAKADLSDNDAARSNFFTTVNRAFGRIGNISEQTMEMLAEITNMKGSLSEAEQTESLVLETSLHEIVDVTITGFTEKMPRLSDTVQLYREVITEMCEIIKMRTIRRFHQSNEKSSIEVMLVDIWYTEEKLMDHCDTIANAIKRYSIETGTYTQSSVEEIQAMRLRIKALFKDKFIMLMETQK